MLIRSYCAALSFIVAAALFSSAFAFLPPPTPPPPPPKVTQFKPYFRAVFHHLLAVVLPSAALCFGAVPPQPANAFGEDIAAKVSSRTEVQKGERCTVGFSTHS